MVARLIIGRSRDGRRSADSMAWTYCAAAGQSRRGAPWQHVGLPTAAPAGRPWRSMSATTSVIVGGARTPVGKLLGSLKDFSATDLGGLAIKAALERAGVSPGPGPVRDHGPGADAGAGQIPARQAAHKAGIPLTVPALTINKVCLSGLDAIALADQLIRAGEFEVVVAGGQESMTQAPHLLPKSREGFKYGTRRDDRPHGLRRPVGCLHRPGDGRADRGRQRRRAGVQPGRAGRLRRPQPPAGGRGMEERHLRRRGGAGLDPAAQGRAAGVPLSTRGSAPTPASSRWPGCARRSVRTAPSPPAPPHRSPTAPQRSW